MRQDIDLTNFTAGELSPRLKGRTDLAKYFNGLDTQLNMVTMPQGGSTRRPGTMYIADSGETNLAKNVRLRRFIFSTVQAYILEWREGFCGIYMNDGQVLSGGFPVSFVHLYTSAELAALKFAQSADTLYVCHGDHQPAFVTRSSHTSWTYTPFPLFRDGPYLDINATAITLTPSATTGNITITASAPLFTLTTDVGRLIRIKVAARWGWVKIDNVISTTQCTADVQAAVTGGAIGADGALDGTAATASWRLGVWSGTTGYPLTVALWQQRLFFGGSKSFPNMQVGSVVGDFTNMAPSQADGTVTAAHAINWTIDDDQVNATRWLSPAGSAQAQQLGIGTSGGEQILQAASASTALTPTSVQAYRETAYGSSNADPLRIGKALLFVDATGRKLREWSFYWQVNGYNGPDLMQLSEHITRAPAGSAYASSGIADMAYAQAPYQIVWARRNDGALIGFTYDRDQTVFAPHQHRLGGNYYGGPPIVESIDVIPSPDGTYDELWLVVKRTINGTPKRFVEVLTRFFDGDAQDFAFFVDAGLDAALTNPAATLTVSGLTNTAKVTDPPQYTGSGTFTASAGVFNSGNVNGIIRVNGGKAQITAYTDTQHVTAQVLAPLQSLAPAAQGAWSRDNQHTSFSGIGHLNGESVAILGDGAVFAQAVVSGGSAALASSSASYATMGLPYTSVLVTMPWEPARAAAASSQGKVKRIDSMWVRFLESLGCLFGLKLKDGMTGAVRENLEPLQTRAAADPMGSAPPLFTGSRRLRPQGGHDEEGQIIITQSDPLPLTVLSIFGRGETSEMPAP